MLLARWYIFISLLTMFCTGRSQVVSQFNWNANPPTAAAVGPNATSAGTSATCSTGGVGGTFGLNPGSPNTDINLTVPNTGNIFDLPNLDMSIDYRRNESTAQMVKRAVFTTNTGGGVANFRVTYRVNNAGTPVTVTSSNVAIPLDNTFRNYRFTYDNCTGVGQMYVNNVVVWTSPSPTVGLNLYWVGDGSVVIGQDMDGASNNVPNLDNFIWQGFTCSTLPIELSGFHVIKTGKGNYITWTTATEINNDYFTVEKSQDGFNWSEVTRVYGAGNSTSSRTYRALDASPEPTMNYYRLLQTDFGGQMKKYSIVTIDNSLSARSIVKYTDLLGREVAETDEGVKLIFYSDGQVEKIIQ